MGLLEKVQKANKVERRIKALFWGTNGTGKSTTALGFEKPILVIDTEKGTEQYGGYYDFDVFPSRDFKEIKDLVKEMGKNPDHGYKTIVVDSLTVFYDLLQADWFDKLTKKNNNPLYRPDGKDWGLIKADFKDFIDDLLLLNTHVVAIAHSKVNYKPGTYMEIDAFNPEKPSLPDDTPHYFDVNLRFSKDHRGQYTVETKKCRIINDTGKEALPPKTSNVNNQNFAKELIAYSNGSKIAPQTEEAMEENVAETYRAIPDELKNQIYDLSKDLKWDKKTALKELEAKTGKKSTGELTYDEAVLFVNYMKSVLNEAVA